MLFLLMVVLMFSFLSSLISFNEAPKIIDFGTLQTVCDNDHNTRDPWRWSLGQFSFNFAPELQSIFVHLRKKFNIDTVVETGTYRGNTTAFFALLFDTVHTVEVDVTTYNETKQRINSRFNNVEIHLGSSEKVLKTLLPQLQNKRLIFYLDAHWGAYCPILDELSMIASTHKDNCIIVIDDFKVPSRPEISYDFYGKTELSLEYIEHKVREVFSEYDYFYIIPKFASNRAKLLLLPKRWFLE